ncbi:MFS transporter [Sphingomonas sp. Mn802worker]|uniref:MFS transporter n=1 Tax=Sphingomonas sp. Mn802worker TaxID=629773 RepID=UPI001EE6BACF|nr:MFS transporter [Sphingomonas sp. Mn802worker]
MGWYKESDGRTRRVFWTTSAGWALDTADGLVFQYLIPLLVLGLGITVKEAGLIASANYFAAAIGGWTGGWLCDRYGRARILQLTILWFSFFSFLSGFAQDFHQLLAIRVLQGLGFGAEWAVGAVLLGELVSPQHRGKALGTVQSGAAVGSGLAALLAGPVAALFEPDMGWRIAFWFGILPAALIFFVRRESDDPEVFREAVAHAAATGERHSMASIFRPRLLRITLLTALLSLGAQGGAYSVGNYTTAFLTLERGLSPSVAGVCVLLLSAGGFFGILTNAYLGDRFGRRFTFRAFALGFMVMASFYLFAPLDSSLWALIPVGLVYGFFQFGIYASFGPYFTELFPTEVRGTGQAFAYNFGRASGALFIFGVGQLAAYLALSAAMAVLAITGMTIALIATFLLPETAGRDLISMRDLN